ncbi:hypothetical protein F5884DRAFT_38107 [Xylogone sp. PMI_703]|nr:hypothetical protein F5884DRAFT_38107 [Xylogone sp. PMI_703]
MDNKQSCLSSPEMLLQTSSMKPSESLPESETSSILAALSINQLARRYCRERLLVDPLEWTDRQLTLLQCSFEDPTPGPSNLPGDPPDTLILINGSIYVNGRFYIDHVACSRALTTRTGYRWRDGKMRGILAGDDAPFIAMDNLHFYFCDRWIRKLPCVGFYLGDENSYSAAASGLVPPVVAYVDDSRIPELRSKRCIARVSRRSSRPTEAISRLKLKKLIPSEPLHDPYIVAVLIAVAWARRYALSPQDTRGSVDYFLSHVLFTTSDNKKDIHLYTADIPSSFLLKLDLPAVPPFSSPPPSFSIRHTVIPRRPYITLRKRLLSILLPAPDQQDSNQGDTGSVREPSEQQERKEPEETPN